MRSEDAVSKETQKNGETASARKGAKIALPCDSNDFGKRVLAAREKARMTQFDLAEYVGVERQRVGKWENGVISPSIPQIVAIAMALGVSTDYLFGLIEFNSPYQSMSLSDRAREILDKARSKGVEHSVLFETTFTRYIECVNHLDRLHRAIVEHGPVVTKEYVKGRSNLVANPAIQQYNSTAIVANDTEKLLMRFIADPVMEGGDGDEFDAFVRK